MTIDEVQNDTTKSTGHIRSVLQFVNSLDIDNHNNLNFSWKYYSDDDHSSVPLIAEYDALRFLYK